MLSAIKRLSLWSMGTHRAENSRYHYVTSHHAVSIRPGRHACEQARELSGNRFLSRHAPELPLEGCDTGDCYCRYRHYDDRRQGLRRSVVIRVTGKAYTGEERRTLPERRRTKHAKGQDYFDYYAGD